MPETSVLAATWAWIAAKAAFLAKLPITLPFAFGGLFLCFLTVPSVRKVSYVVIAMFSTIMLSTMAAQFGEQWGWGQATINAVCGLTGYFSLAFALSLGKMHEAILADDTMVKAALERMKRWIGGTSKSEDK